MTFPSASRTPSTSVRKTSRSAWSAAASADAAESAFTFRSVPSRPSATDATMGRSSAPRIARMRRGFENVTRPTYPKSTPSSRGWNSAQSVSPSAPETPADVTPRERSSATSDLFTRPERIDTTTSSVSGSVILRPRYVFFGILRAWSEASMRLPPPWTTTTFSPDVQLAAIAARARARGSASSRMLPPSFTTIGRPGRFALKRVPPSPRIRRHGSCSGRPKTPPP